MLQVAVKNALKLLQDSQGVIKQFTPQASGALDKLITLFHPDTLKIGTDTASATLTAGNSAAIATVRQLRLDPKHIQDCLSGLYGHISPQDWTQLNELFGLIKGHENALEILGEDGLKVINQYFSSLKQNPLAAVTKTVAAVPKGDTEAVLEEVLGIFSAKVSRPDGHVHNISKVLNALGIKGIPSPQEIPGYLQKHIITDDFKDCLRACIEGKTPNEALLNGGFWQKKAFSLCQGLLNQARDNPEIILKGGPQASYFLRYSAGPIMGFLRGIPVFGWLLSWLFPFAVDLVGSTGEQAVNDKLKNIINILQKNKPRNASQQIAPVPVLNPGLT